MNPYAFTLFPTAGLCPKTLHLDLVIPPPWGGFDPGRPTAVSFGSANATAELPGKG